MLKLYMKQGQPRFMKECAVEVSAVLGFYSLSMNFPLLIIDENHQNTGDTLVRLDCNESLEKCYSLKISENEINLVLRDSGGIQDALSELCAALAEPREASKSAIEFDREPSGYHQWPEKRGLESLFERDFLVTDTDNDFLPDKINALIALPGDCDDFALSAACDIAARLGMETLALELPILLSPERECPDKAVISIEYSDECGISLDESKEPLCIRICGSGESFAAMVSLLCRRFPEAGNETSWFKACGNIASALAMRNLDGQISWLAASGDKEAHVYADPSIEGKREILEKEFPSVQFKNRRDLVPLYEKEYELPWEVDICKKHLEENVYPLVKAGGKYEVTVIVSEDAEVRKELENEIKSTLLAKGCVDPVARVVCAFKQGFSWIRDYIIPELQSLSDSGRSDPKSDLKYVDIEFSPFLPEGRSAWTDEDGAMPKITAQRKDNPDAWMETPIRLLQELYPIDDFVASALSINRDEIKFRLYEEADGFMGYRLRAFDSKREMIFEATHDVKFSERPYLDTYPGIGKAHPSTGRIVLRENGAVLFDACFQTDLERIWAIYQSEVLPTCADHIRAVCGGSIQIEKQPFFAQLRLDIDASEPNEKLPFRQDWVSSLDSLHEDIYFTGLDYFHTLGIRECGKIIDSPGLILPVIRKRSGKPRMRFSLLSELSGQPALESGGKRCTEKIKDADVYINRFDYISGELCPHIRVSAKENNGDMESFVSSWSTLFEKGLLNASLELAGIPQLRIETEGASRKLIPPAAAPKPPKLDIRDIDVHETMLFGYAEYMELIEKFSRVPQLRVRKIAESRLGRDIHSIELLPDLDGYVSKTKLIAERPVYYVNSRHHANEISSTNSAFMLVKTLLTDPAYRDIRDRLNIVVVPFENADGAAIHYELAAENPEWILHIARYNSLGREISFEYWKDDTIHTEAMAFTNVWRQWLPDAVTDNHGVPTHEWCQQFAGYTSPWFKGFWMPRALLYEIFWYLTDEQFKPHKKLMEAAAKAVARRVHEDSEWDTLNQEYKERFEKYAHSWMPKLFPADYENGLICYWVPFEYKKQESYYACIRFPQVTAVFFVSEVSDETARGDFLELCARTHVLNDLAIIDMLKECRAEIQHTVKKENGVLRCSKKRLRPLDAV